MRCGRGGTTLFVGTGLPVRFVMLKSSQEEQPSAAKRHELSRKTRFGRCRQCEHSSCDGFLRLLVDSWPCVVKAELGNRTLNRFDERFEQEGARDTEALPGWRLLRFDARSPDDSLNELRLGVNQLDTQPRDGCDSGKEEWAGVPGPSEVEESHAEVAWSSVERIEDGSDDEALELPIEDLLESTERGPVVHPLIRELNRWRGWGVRGKSELFRLRAAHHDGDAQHDEARAAHGFVVPNGERFPTAPAVMIPTARTA